MPNQEGVQSAASCLLVEYMLPRPRDSLQTTILGVRKKVELILKAKGGSVRRVTCCGQSTLRYTLGYTRYRAIDERSADLQLHSARRRQFRDVCLCADPSHAQVRKTFCSMTGLRSSDCLGEHVFSWIITGRIAWLVCNGPLDIL